MAGIVIAERTQGNIPVQMLLTGDNMISVVSKSKVGRKHDCSHDVEDFYEADPLLASELRKIKSPYEQMLPWVLSFIAQMWEEVEDLDPWYIVEDEDLDS